MGDNESDQTNHTVYVDMINQHDYTATLEIQFTEIINTDACMNG